MAREVDCVPILPAAADVVHAGCPVLTKQRHFVLAKGQCGTAEWEMRWPDGVTADFSACLTADSVSADSVSADAYVGVQVRFQGCDRNSAIYEVDGTVVTDGSDGLIRFPIPQQVCCGAGIYTFQAAVTRDSTSVIFADGGMISVEHGLWGDTGDAGGPPTLQTIRFHLRDRAAENDLLQDVEFDDAEIIEAIRKPVEEFNETPPTLTPFSCATFPYHYHWRNAVVAELLRTAAHHYVRNKMNISSGGLVGDDKDKDRDYLRVAMLYIQEWKDFIVQKKSELNIRQGYFSAGSDYGLSPW